MFIILIICYALHPLIVNNERALEGTSVCFVPVVSQWEAGETEHFCSTFSHSYKSGEGELEILVTDYFAAVRKLNK